MVKKKVNRVLGVKKNIAKEIGETKNTRDYFDYYTIPINLEETQTK